MDVSVIFEYFDINIFHEIYNYKKIEGTICKKNKDDNKNYFVKKMFTESDDVLRYYTEHIGFEEFGQKKVLSKQLKLIKNTKNLILYNDIYFCHHKDFEDINEHEKLEGDIDDLKHANYNQHCIIIVTDHLSSKEFKFKDLMQIILEDKNKKEINEKFVLQVFKHIVEGLQELKKVGLSHGNLKP